jgi:hypothetical protein
VVITLTASQRSRLPVPPFFVKVCPTMPLSRPFLPLFLAFALLFAQQGGAAHALGHAFEQTSQHDKQAPHSPACEQCAAYAQLDSALGVGTHDFSLAAVTGEELPPPAISFRSIHVLAAAARGPPHSLRNIA